MENETRRNPLGFLVSRTAILLYVSMTANFAMYNGYLIDKTKLQITVCAAVSDAVANYEDDNALSNAIDAKIKPVNIEEK